MNSSLAHAAAHRGFEGTIFGATLSDLVQMECLAMTTRAVRVEHNSRSGRIYFAGGQIVHAETEGFSGEPALVEMLRWMGGHFTVEDGVRPMEDTIARDWHTLLLEAAHCADELTARDPNSHSAKPNTIMTAMPSRDPSSGSIFDQPEIIGGVRFTEDGTLLESRTEDSDTLQSSFAYVVQLMQLVGRDLGLENFKEMQATGTTQKALCIVQETETKALILSPKANLSTLARRLA